MSDPQEVGRGHKWIIVPNWFASKPGADDGLQHYRDREPKWIKNYRRLLSKDEYRQLSGHCRGILHGLWLEYAMSDGRLRDDSSSISSRLGLRVTKQHLELLNHAGFIHFSASEPLALRYQVASLEVEVDKEKRLSRRDTPRATTPAASAIERAIRNGALTDPIDVEAEITGSNINSQDAQRLRELLGERHAA